MNIENKVVLVTGANRGIGKAIVESVIRHGAKKVYLAVRNLETTNQQVSEFGDKVVPVKVDIADASSIQALAKQAQDVDIVINNAGVLAASDLLTEQVEETLDYEMNVNVYGLLRMARAFYPILESKPESAFVQLNSIASIKNFTDFTSYSASKAAAFSITQGLRERFLSKGIQVLSVHPGPILTDMAQQAGIDEIAEPPSFVAEAIVEGLLSEQYLVFTDTMAKQFESVYSGYAEAMILPIPEFAE
jgi:NAD(P)-dependent dehydrogenase (short-subunit alcohol dehydrogenase family)